MVVQQPVHDTRVPELFECGAKDYLKYFCIGWLFQPAAGYAIGKKLKETNLCARHILHFVLLFAVIISLVGYYLAVVVQAVYGDRKRYKLYSIIQYIQHSGVNISEKSDCEFRQYRTGEYYEWCPERDNEMDNWTLIFAVLAGLVGLMGLIGLAMVIIMILQRKKAF